MKKYNLPKAKFSSEPFVDGFVEIEKENVDLTIGNSEKLDDVFVGDNPEYLKLLCSISSKSDFKDVVISARYREKDGESVKIMSHRLYDGSSADMSGLVSEISIECLEIIPEEGIVKSSWKDLLAENKVIYTKQFQTQKLSKNIDNFIDRDLEETSIIHTKSKAHFFAGSYFQGIKFSDIQQYLFYVGTGYRAEPYISVISAKDICQSKKAKLNADVSMESLSTLEDDVCDGKISITFPDDNATYKSVVAYKNTLTSAVFQILFKRYQLE
ncbi:MAG: hypothetical protein LBM19_00615 [Holosporales bacterium]|jgi:hypothetical protein|nr:hypothetical protein [Holosporales bacterium]